MFKKKKIDISNFLCIFVEVKKNECMITFWKSLFFLLFYPTHVLKNFIFFYEKYKGSWMGLDAWLGHQASPLLFCFEKIRRKDRRSVCLI